MAIVLEYNSIFIELIRNKSQRVFEENYISFDLKINFIKLNISLM
jgi:hypothetical protein